MISLIFLDGVQCVIIILSEKKNIFKLSGNSKWSSRLISDIKEHMREKNILNFRCSDKNISLHIFLDKYELMMHFCPLTDELIV